jgi:hypothetical protein
MLTYGSPGGMRTEEDLPCHLLVTRMKSLFGDK